MKKHTLKKESVEVESASDSQEGQEKSSETLAGILATGSDSEGQSIGSEGSSKVKRGIEVEQPYPGFVRVTEDHCRIIYAENVGSYKKEPTICLKKKDCKSTLGGINHKGRRELEPDIMIKPGFYEAATNASGTIVGAQPGTYRSLLEMKNYIRSRNMDAYQQFQSLEALRSGTVDDAFFPKLVKQEEKLKVTAKEEPSSSSPVAQVSFKLEPEESKPILPSFATKLKKENETKNDISIDVKLAKMEESIWSRVSDLLTAVQDKHVQQNDILLQALKDLKSSNTETNKTESQAVAETDKLEKALLPNPVLAPKNGTPNTVTARSKDEQSSDSSDASATLYVIASGVLDPDCIGFYNVPFADIKPLVHGVNGAAYTTVDDYDDGFTFIKNHHKMFRSKCPSWVRKGVPYFPDLKKLKKLLQKSKSHKKKKASHKKGKSSRRGSDPDPSASDPSDESDDTQYSDDDDSDESERHSSDTDTKSKSKRSHRKKGSKKDKVDSISDFGFQNSIRPDESMGKNDELFGVSVNNHHELVEELTPVGMGKRTSEAFFDQITDFSAYPKQQGKTSNNDVLNKLANVAEQAFTRRKHTLNSNIDSGYQDSTRNFLLTFAKESDDDKLLETQSNLTAASGRLLTRFLGKLTGVLQQVYIHDTTIEIEEMAKSTLVFRIGRDTLQYYENLLTHHVGMLGKHDWDEVKFCLLFHGRKMADVRQEYSTRAQVICALYIYLRNYNKTKWTDITLVQKQLEITQKKVDTRLTNLNTNASSSSSKKKAEKDSEKEPEGDSLLAGLKLCGHCRTYLHAPGKKNCPWKTKGRGEAQRLAKAFMLSRSLECVEIKEDEDTKQDDEPDEDTDTQTPKKKQ